MKNPEEKLADYRQFLTTIPLKEYRENFKSIKWVEQDLYKKMLPQWSIFRCYWESENFMSFDEWFEDFWKELHSSDKSHEVLKEFMKYYFDKDDNGWFKKGFKARMYRTWASVLTQLDLCYVLVYLSDKLNIDLSLEANADLDIKGIDLIVNGVSLGVTKISERKEARAGKKKRLISVPYAVFNMEVYKKRIESTRVTPENRQQYKRTVEAFYEYFHMLGNGFVVFADEYGKRILENSNDESALKQAIENISSEIRGEA